VTTYVHERVRADATSVTDGGATNRSRVEEPKRMTKRRDVQSSNLDQMSEGSFPASDPPSSTGAISRIAMSAEQRHIEGLARRVRAEYLEMPGLCLTLEQAQRLWSVERRTCEALIKSLTDARFLHRTERGLFLLRANRVSSKECA